jgi:hypothetical protein
LRVLKANDLDHVAIMRKSWGLTQKILSGQKKIESRWYKVRYAPWDRIKPDEVVYFKDSGEPVTIRAEVDKVIQFSDLTPEEVEEILYQYGQADGIEIDKKYCILIFLRKPQEIKPFEIDKSGFGAMSAWICVDDINMIKANP